MKEALVLGVVGIIAAALFSGIGMFNYGKEVKYNEITQSCAEIGAFLEPSVDGIKVYACKRVK